MVTSDSGVDAKIRVRRLQAKSAFGGEMPDGRLFWFPPIDLAFLALGRIASTRPESWRGSAFCFVSDAVARRSPNRCHFEKVMRILTGAEIFAKNE